MPDERGERLEEDRKIRAAAKELGLDLPLGEREQDDLLAQAMEELGDK